MFFRVGLVNGDIYFIFRIFLRRLHKKQNSTDCRHSPCCGKHCALSGILTSPSAAVSWEVERLLETCPSFDVLFRPINDNTRVFDVCCILSPCWHATIQSLIDSHVAVFREGERSGETRPEGNVLHPLTLPPRPRIGPFKIQLPTLGSGCMHVYVHFEVENRFWRWRFLQHKRLRLYRYSYTFPRSVVCLSAVIFGSYFCGIHGPRGKGRMGIEPPARTCNCKLLLSPGE